VAEGPSFPAIRRSQLGVVSALGLSQTLAWASSYYLPAILADPMAADLGVSRGVVFGAFSASLLIAAVLGPAVGRAIDRRGGRGVLMWSSLVLAAGLAALAAASEPIQFIGAWVVLGIGMAMGLYDSAFAALTALYGREARGPITGITLIAGFASTVGWPLTSLLNGAVGWRETCLIWAAVNLLMVLPLNRLALPAVVAPPEPHASAGGKVGWKPYREMLLLAFVFSACWFVTGAMAAHLPRLLERAGATPVEAVAASALVGPAQVGARFAEFLVLRRLHPLTSARLAAALHPVGAVALVLIGPAALPLFVILYGAGNGLLTIARGTVPLALFGPSGYGERTGLLGAPARATQALAPLAFGLLVDQFGLGAILVSAGACVAALAALLCLRVRSR
jgi:MFS family permease